MGIRQQNLIATAKMLLSANPSLSMEAIAMQAGFSGRDAGSIAFRKLEHLTPTEYKKAYDQNENQNHP